MTLKILKQAAFREKEGRILWEKPENRGASRRKIAVNVREGGRTVGSGTVAKIIE